MSLLTVLSEAPDRALPMSRLAEATRTSASRLSQAARFEERGWVERTTCPSGRRGQVARLTDDGYAVLVDNAPGHVREVARLVFGPLTRDQVHQLEQLATRITARVSGRDEAKG